MSKGDVETARDLAKHNVRIREFASADFVVTACPTCQTALKGELVKLVGMLKYRYSYAQNVLMHSMECAFLAGAMAAELGLNEKQARRAGLLHDIGKALTHEVEGSHAIIGADIARKYGESAKIVNAIAAHHEEMTRSAPMPPRSCCAANLRAS